MEKERTNDFATPAAPAWSSRGGQLEHATDDEVAADVDEPPDLGRQFIKAQFKRNVVPKIVDHTESLLTKALHQPEEELVQLQYPRPSMRRRSMASNVSLASTVDLTSDTGFTSPARTNTPSPPAPMIRLLQLDGYIFDEKQRFVGHNSIDKGAPSRQPVPVTTGATTEQKNPTRDIPQKKRCISFACAKPEAKKSPSLLQTRHQPQPTAPAGPTPAVEEKPQRKSCIKFACPSKPAPSTTSGRCGLDLSLTKSPPNKKSASPIASRKHPSSPETRGRKRSPAPGPANVGDDPVRSSKYLTADASDLDTESSRFHAFASDEPLEDDWIRQNFPFTSTRLTIDDTLWKENEIRRLGKEAEEEALEEEDDADIYADDTYMVDDSEEDDEDVADHSNDGSDDNASDGYNTDNEIGFADSEEEEDGDFELPVPILGLPYISNRLPIGRRPPSNGEKYDTSSSEGAKVPLRSRRRIRRTTPELPDSTDFVCGTLDEDRDLENEYISCIASKRLEKLHLIPQDIDPSFPTSEPEDEEMEHHKRNHGSGENLWINGELEDLDHVGELGGERRKRSGQTSPRRYHSPPPKARGRSPRRLFDTRSPRRLVSPPPYGRITRSPPASLVQGGQLQNGHLKTLAFRPGLTHTKSLPRAPALFPPHMKNVRKAERERISDYSGHVRGAIDIVKGLEQKRQRRREKFKEKYLQKHNNKARKGQLPQQRPQPGQGAQRMREIGLLSAGKRDPDQYVLSV
ncbi:hypothetical protein GGS20DRAFT_575865 [Poronia punctata]|nr:hypothetical protein GGS20DRAFT_575865 [Poronia punctata]